MFMRQQHCLAGFSQELHIILQLPAAHVHSPAILQQFMQTIVPMVLLHWHTAHIRLQPMHIILQLVEGHMHFMPICPQLRHFIMFIIFPQQHETGIFLHLVQHMSQSSWHLQSIAFWLHFWHAQFAIII
jgi:hypothetical protein